MTDLTLPATDLSSGTDGANLFCPALNIYRRHYFVCDCGRKIRYSVSKRTRPFAKSLLIAPQSLSDLALSPRLLEAACSHRFQQSPQIVKSIECDGVEKNVLYLVYNGTRILRLSTMPIKNDALDELPIYATVFASAPALLF